MQTDYGTDLVTNYLVLTEYLVCWLNCHPFRIQQTESVGCWLQLWSLLDCFEGFTPDVKVWEVGFDKVGGYTGCKRAFELKGHSAGVYSFSFNSDSSR